jgi:hypothetical protein
MLKRKTIEYSVEQFRDGDQFKIITLNKKKNKTNVNTIGIENPNYVIYQNKNVRFISQSKVEVEVEEGDYDFLKYIESKENIIDEKIEQKDSLDKDFEKAKSYVDKAKENSVSVMIEIIEQDTILYTYPGLLINNNILIERKKNVESVVVKAESTLKKVKKVKMQAEEEIELLIDELDEIKYNKKVWVEVKSWRILNNNNIFCKSDDRYNYKFGEDYIFDRE